MDEQEKQNALRLISTPNIGPVTYSLLIARYKTATQAIAQAPLLANRQGRKLAIAPRTVADKIMQDTAKAGATLLIKGDETYPHRLARFDDAPAVLFAKGHLSLLKKDTVAIVGARNASTNAIRMTAQWAADIGAADMVILSDLARGIDRAAHVGSLKTGTIGVIGCGIDLIYPQENEDLYQEMVQSGLILTEFVPGTKPSPRNFPSRNRIIASLAKGTIVVEAAMRSGSLITAKEANERGGEVMAIPGAPSDPRAHGTNQLIKDGAHLVSSPQDVLDIMLSISLSEPSLFPPPLQTQILDDIDDETVAKLANEIMNILTFEAADIDELTRQCHVSAKVIQIALLELELAGHVQRLSGNRICKLLNYD